MTMNFHGDDVPNGVPESAFFHVIQVPYERTVSYGAGTAEGPGAIVQASTQLELFDGRSIPADHGIYTAPAVDCSGEPEEVLQRIGAAVGACLNQDRFPVVLGGEHTVTIGIVDALINKHAEFGIIQFDAHADLRDQYQGSPFSHACVMRRIHDRSIPFFQIGTRSYSHQEHLFRQKHKIPCLNAEEIFQGGIEAFSMPADFPEKIFLTFDIDALDSALMPATGTPVPGGLTWYQAMRLIEKIMASRVCVGFDVVEFAPIPSLHGASFAAAQLVYNLMGYVTRSTLNREFWQL